MKFFRKMLLPITFAFIISGCSNANNEADDVNGEVTNEISPENKNEVANEEVTSKNEEPKRNNPLDLHEIVSLDKEGIIALLGQPQDLYEWEDGQSLSYDGLSVSLNSSQKLESLEISNDAYLFNGIMIGNTLDDVRQKLGKPTKEGIAESGEFFELVYDTVINENITNSVYFTSSDFNSPVDFIGYSTLDTTPLFTTEEVKKMIVGSWVSEEDMLMEDYSDLVYFTENKFVTDSFNGTINGLVRDYKITNFNTIEISDINTYSDKKQWDIQTIEFSPDGRRIELYRVDSYSGKIYENSRQVYYKYSDTYVVK
ncbi:hypothetical protein [Metasolibacillus fluoroglycofenilyticus]|uniref:hypothetical protein n=1 Tax=Metasolibacillus fluoroglycofenilyticus TaxID=1239396 RepID=UPI00128FEE24|nr:hypothetical protein [Metasolibacillus fluoroglycofenilyticus]